MSHDGVHHYACLFEKERGKEEVYGRLNMMGQQPQRDSNVHEELQNDLMEERWMWNGQP
jgi:hypothetical protein